MTLQLTDYAGSGLGVVISGDAKQRHAGFIFTDEGVTELLHLAWHFCLKRDTPSSYMDKAGSFCAYLCDDLLDSQSEEVVSFLNMIWRRNRHVIPYGISSDGIETFFDTTGSIASPNVGEGLTCATFIMGVFSKLGLNLIDTSNWERRSTDSVWHRHILDNLSRHPHYQPEVIGHAAAQERHVGVAYRYRPEEVVGCAAAMDEEPKKFHEAVTAGESVLRDMSAKGVLMDSNF